MQLPAKQEWALGLVTMIWGATFLVIHLAMERSGPLFFVGARFGVASLALLVVSARSMNGFTARELFRGLFLGCIVFSGFALQTAGLVSVDSSKSAFLTAFYVPLVPVLQWLFLGKRPSARAMLALLLAFLGVVLVSGGLDMTLEGSRGELLTLLCALLFAGEIVTTGAVAPGCDTRRLTLVVLATTSLLSFALMPATGESVPPFSPFLALAAIGLGLSTALVQSVIVWAQKTVDPARATLIYSGEPVWGGIFGYLGGERMDPAAIVGCGLILSGLLTGAALAPKSGKKHGHDGARQA